MQVGQKLNRGRARLLYGSLVPPGTRQRLKVSPELIPRFSQRAGPGSGCSPSTTFGTAATTR